MTKNEMKLEALIESLYRVSEFRRWVQTNVLFPVVPDTIVHPILQHLRNAEHELVKQLYDNDALDKVAAIQKTLALSRKTVVK